MKRRHCAIFSRQDMKNVKPMNKTVGMIHSFETFGTLDGPGLRFVVFMEGCPLRCVYCHNRDMLDLIDYMEMTPKELMDKVLDYKEYFGKKGGVTLSGGDPVYQPKFALEFAKMCKKKGIHVTLDTSLFTTKKFIDDIFPYVDLWMVSLKHFDNDIHRCLTGVGNEKILENAKYLSGKLGRKGGKGFGLRPKLWFRYLILPGYTDTRKNLKALVEFLKEMNFELVELLPYHTYGIYKWEKLGVKYTLEGVKPPSLRVVKKIKKRLEYNGFKVLVTQ